MKIVIIGNGIAGSTAALTIRKHSDHEISMISSESKFPFSRTALMYLFMGQLPFENTKLHEDHFWKQQNIHLIQAHVDAVDFEQKLVVIENGQSIPYDRLIIATGSKANRCGCAGEDALGVQSLYHLNDLTSIETSFNTGIDHAVIVGGGLIGIELQKCFVHVTCL